MIIADIASLIDVMIRQHKEQMEEQARQHREQMDKMKDEMKNLMHVEAAHDGVRGSSIPMASFQPFDSNS